MTWVLAAVCGLATVPAGLRWLRVAQREHYLPPSVTRFAARWWRRDPLNLGLVGVAMIGLAGSLWSPWLGFLVPAAQLGPIGLTVRGRTSPLAWTGRLRRLAILAGAMVLAFYLAGALVVSPFLVVLGLILLPVLIDLALVLLSPIEQNLGNRWVEQAAARLKGSGAKVVAITGSYGKTTTKLYVGHLLAGAFRTVVSPASFNNRMGLARAINENLVPGTQVFVAEMGTYGPGEIAALTGWIPPDVSALVAVGPVHLERFKTEERIVSAKAEILDGAGVAVIAVDHPLLAALASERATRMEVIAVSSQGAPARVKVNEGWIRIDGVEVVRTPDHVFEVNLAVALGIGLALGLSAADLTSRLDGLPRAEHRQTVATSDRGFTVIDDTFNSNPAGARSGLRLLVGLGLEGRTAVVTPGMVELGSAQFAQNRDFASEAAAVVDHLIIVGATNREALLQGSGNSRASVSVVASREEAVDWVRDHLGPGDAVLYENDLPDHYP